MDFHPQSPYYSSNSISPYSRWLPDYQGRSRPIICEANVTPARIDHRPSLSGRLNNATGSIQLPTLFASRACCTLYRVIPNRPALTSGQVGERITVSSSLSIQTIDENGVARVIFKLRAVKHTWLADLLHVEESGRFQRLQS